MSKNLLNWSKARWIDHIIFTKKGQEIPKETSSETIKGKLTVLSLTHDFVSTNEKLKQIPSSCYAILEHEYHVSNSTDLLQQCKASKFHQLSESFNSPSRKKRTILL